MMLRAIPYVSVEHIPFVMVNMLLVFLGALVILELAEKWNGPKR